MIEGRKILIGDTFLCDFFLYFRSHLSKENKDDWVIALKFNYNYDMLMVKTDHNHRKLILKLIHGSIENGINVKRNKLIKERILLICLFFINDNGDLTDQIIEKLFDKKRLYVAWDQLINVFKLLLFGSILSCCCLIIEIFYSLSFKCLKFFKCF